MHCLVRAAMHRQIRNRVALKTMLAQKNRTVDRIAGHRAHRPVGAKRLWLSNKQRINLAQYHI